MPIHQWTRVIPDIFHDFHHGWISAISRSLNSRALPFEYYALIEQIASRHRTSDQMFEQLSAQPTGSVGNWRENTIPREKSGVALQSVPPKVRFTAATETEQYAHRR